MAKKLLLLRSRDEILRSLSSPSLSGQQWTSSSWLGMESSIKLPLDFTIKSHSEFESNAIVCDGSTVSTSTERQRSIKNLRARRFRNRGRERRIRLDGFYNILLTQNIRLHKKLGQLLHEKAALYALIIRHGFQTPNGWQSHIQTSHRTNNQL